jgi:hypothetical protein
MDLTFHIWFFILLLLDRLLALSLHIHLTCLSLFLKLLLGHKCMLHTQLYC